MSTILKRSFDISDSLALQYRRQLVERDMAKVYEAARQYNAAHRTLAQAEPAKPSDASPQKPTTRP